MDEHRRRWLRRRWCTCGRRWPCGVAAVRRAQQAAGTQPPQEWTARTAQGGIE